MIMNKEKFKKRIASNCCNSVKKEFNFYKSSYRPVEKRSKRTNSTKLNKNKDLSLPESTINYKLKPTSRQEEQPSNLYFMTMADLTSADGQQLPKNQQPKQTQVNNIQEQSGQRKENVCVKVDKIDPSFGIEVSNKLDETIGKLKSKQNTIDLLNKTIHTRIIDSHPPKGSGSNRFDVYDLEMNFYIDRITQLQKQLYQKTKNISSLQQKHIDYHTVTKNNRKLIGQNHRLQEQNQMLQRESQALKKLLLKRMPSK